MSRTIQLRRDAAASWTSVNPVLAQGELAYETDTDKFKIGDGTTAWTSLDYILDTAVIDPNITATSVNTNTLQVAGIGYPTADGTSNQVLTTNGLGVLSFQDSGSSSFDGAYSSLSGQPSLFDGAYSSLSGSPSIPSSLTDLSISDGTANQVLTTNGSGAFTFADTAGGGRSFEATTGGAMSDGDPVVIQSDGTVVKAGISLGLPTTNKLSSSINSTDLNGGTNGHFVRIPGTTTAVVLHQARINNVPQHVSYLVNVDASGVVTKISPDYLWDVMAAYGANVRKSDDHVESIIVYYDTSINKLVFGYLDLNNDGQAKLFINKATVNSDSISWGSATELSGIFGYHGSGTYISSMAHNPTNNEVCFSVYTFQNGSQNRHQLIYKLTNGATTTSSLGRLGTPIESNESWYNPQMTYVPWANAFALLTHRQWNYYTTKYNRVQVQMISGSIGTPYEIHTFDSASGQGITAQHGYIALDTTNQKLMIIYYTGTSSGQDFNVKYATATSGYISCPSQTGITISGSGITGYGTSYFNVGRTETTNQTVVILARRGQGASSNETHYKALDLSYDPVTTEVVKSAEYDFDTASAQAGMVAFAAPFEDRIVVSTRDQTRYWSVISIKPPQTTSNVTNENYAGISDGAYASGATATIQTSGAVDDAQSGLTAGQAYFLQSSGSLATAPGTPRVFAGVAVSSTKLLIAKNDIAPSYTELSNLPSLFDGAYSSLTGAPSIPATLTDVGITDGTSNQVLTTNGAGGFSFQTVSQAAAEWDSQDVSLAGNSSVTVTGIPAGVRQVIIGFKGQAGTSNILIQLGDVNGIETSSYDSFGIRVNGTSISSSASSTSGFILRGMTSVQEGSIILSLIDAANNRWGMNSNLGGGSNTEMCISTGGGDIGSALTQIKISAVSGNFDAGSQIGVSYL